MLCLLLSTGYLFGQPLQYTTANVHSHNDYEQKIPFWLAYNQGLGSMEADIFLENGELLVAHTRKELAHRRTLEEYYLLNLQRCLQKNNNHPYADSSKKLQVLIDIKTDSIATLDTLIAVLKKYPALINNPLLSFVITGNRPAASLWTSYPSFINFDGVLSVDYSKQALQKIVLFSDDLKNYTQWNGKGAIPVEELQRLQSSINKAHQSGKPVRFWNAPDFINAWNNLMQLGVDYINTDHIDAIAAFLNNLPTAGYNPPTGTAAVYQLIRP